jgi:hypothetical protein
MKREQLNELMDEFYGTEGEDYGPEDGDFEGGVIEDNYALADWARNVVPDLFDAISKLLGEKEESE